MHVEVVLALLGTKHVTSPVYLQHTIITLYQARIKLNVLCIGRCGPKENPEENTRALPVELLRPRNLSRILRSRHLDGISNHIEATCCQKRHESMAPVVCTARRRAYGTETGPNSARISDQFPPGVFISLHGTPEYPYQNSQKMVWGQNVSAAYSVWGLCGFAPGFAACGALFTLGMRLWRVLEPFSTGMHSNQWSQLDCL
jgi:hypothetical protein